MIVVIIYYLIVTALALVGYGYREGKGDHSMTGYLLADLFFIFIFAWALFPFAVIFGIIMFFVLLGKYLAETE